MKTVDCRPGESDGLFAEGEKNFFATLTTTPPLKLAPRAKPRALFCAEPATCAPPTALIPASILLPQREAVPPTVLIHYNNRAQRTWNFFKRMRLANSILTALISLPVLTASPIGVVVSLNTSSLQIDNQVFSTSAVPGSIGIGNGSIYVTFADGSISQYSTSGVLQERFATDALATFSALGTGADGLYGAVYETSPEIANIQGIVSNGYDFGTTPATTALAASVTEGDGSIWGTLANGTIVQYSSTNGSLQVTFAGGGFGALAFGDGLLFAVVDNLGEAPEIQHVYDFVDNGYSDDTEIPTATLATNLAVGGGSIYAAFADGTIARYDETTGALISSVTYSNYDWTGLSITDGTLFASAAETLAPEPGTSSLTCGAIVLLALGRRRFGTSPKHSK
jgi:hypothetical protein